MPPRQGAPAWFDDPDHLADTIIAHVGKSIVLALPLGLGKAVHVANALFARAVADPSIHLRIFTALTLDRPRGKPGLERRFVAPLAERLFGGYPELAYATAQRAGLRMNAAMNVSPVSIRFMSGMSSHCSRKYPASKAIQNGDSTDAIRV